MTPRRATLALAAATAIVGGLAALPGCSDVNEVVGDPPALPEASLSEDVALVMHFSGLKLSPDRLRAAGMAMIDAAPDAPPDRRAEAVAELDAQLAEFGAAYGELKDAGVRAISVAVAPPASPGEPPAGMLMFRTTPGADLGAIHASLVDLAAARGEPMDPRMSLQRLSDTWAYYTGYEDDDGRLVAPTGGSAEATEAFERRLKEAGGGASLAFRMTPALREQTEALINSAPPIVAGAAAPLTDLEVALLGVTAGGEPSVAAELRFPDEATASAFLGAWNGLLTMARGFASTPSMLLSEPPSNRALNGIFAGLAMRQDGATLSLSLGAKFVGHLAALDAEDDDDGIDDADEAHE